jgi:hypothetical protein
MVRKSRARANHVILVGCSPGSLVIEDTALRSHSLATAVVHERAQRKRAVDLASAVVGVRRDGRRSSFTRHRRDRCGFPFFRRSRDGSIRDMGERIGQQQTTQDPSMPQTAEPAQQQVAPPGVQIIPGVGNGQTASQQAYGNVNNTSAQTQQTSKGPQPTGVGGIAGAIAQWQASKQPATTQSTQPAANAAAAGAAGAAQSTQPAAAAGATGAAGAVSAIQQFQASQQPSTTGALPDPAALDNANRS